MMHEFLSSLADTMATHGFRQVPSPVRAVPSAELLLKRQTWNTNRAIIVVCPQTPPPDFIRYLRDVRRNVAFRCGFCPVFWGIGIQVIAIGNGLLDGSIDPAKHVAVVDNQWAIIQSIFLVDPTQQQYRTARTWGQVVTGRFQDAIDAVVGRYFRLHDG